ncbi:TPA: hypothetical protein DEG21_00145 [Patescibacteria group bacterium]|nr:hypothetical protein [Candidatus Gracilibacteria bacterium]HBY74339.1 hypothetical protein [Candidatus Gracilibacteria bacterium]
MFKDVSSIKPNTWSCRAIEISSDFGVVSKTNQYFRPESNITRAEALAIVMKAASIDSSTSSEASQFWDVQNSWQIKATNKALELGIIDKSTNFRPNQNATR